MKLQVGHGLVLGLLIREIFTFTLKMLKGGIETSITNLLACNSCAIPRALRKSVLMLKQAWIFLSGAWRYFLRLTPTKQTLSVSPAPPSDSPPKESASSSLTSEPPDASTSDPRSG